MKVASVSVDLLGRGPRGDQPVETADGTAGDGDEDEWEDRRSALGVEIHCRRLERRAQDEEAHEYHGDAQVEEERVDVVPGLEEQPDRQHRGEEGVGQ